MENYIHDCATGCFGYITFQITTKNFFSYSPDDSYPYKRKHIKIKYIEY